MARAAYSRGATQARNCGMKAMTGLPGSPGEGVGLQVWVSIRRMTGEPGDGRGSGKSVIFGVWLAKT